MVDVLALLADAFYKFQKLTSYLNEFLSVYSIPRFLVKLKNRQIPKRDTCLFGVEIHVTTVPDISKLNSHDKSVWQTYTASTIAYTQNAYTCEADASEHHKVYTSNTDALPHTLPYAHL